MTVGVGNELQGVSQQLLGGELPKVGRVDPMLLQIAFFGLPDEPYALYDDRFACFPLTVESQRAVHTHKGGHGKGHNTEGQYVIIANFHLHLSIIS